MPGDRRDDYDTGVLVEILPVSYAEILSAPNWPVLLAAYGAECSIPEIGEIAPQAAMYAQMEASGIFQAFAAYEREELIGFASDLVFPLPHYGQTIANAESIFLSPAHRNSHAGNGLMNALEDYAKEKNCQVISYSARTGSQFERLLSLLKPYQRTNSVFMRSLQPLQR
jgi:GNAT superfamily N-acetyltransferase